MNSPVIQVTIQQATNGQYLALRWPDNQLLLHNGNKQVLELMVEAVGWKLLTPEHFELN